VKSTVKLSSSNGRPLLISATMCSNMMFFCRGRLLVQHFHYQNRKVESHGRVALWRRGRRCNPALLWPGCGRIEQGQWQQERGCFACSSASPIHHTQQYRPRTYCCYSYCHIHAYPCRLSRPVTRAALHIPQTGRLDDVQGLGDGRPCIPSCSYANNLSTSPLYADQQGEEQLPETATTAREVVRLHTTEQRRALGDWLHRSTSPALLSTLTSPTRALERSTSTYTLRDLCFAILEVQRPKERTIETFKLGLGQQHRKQLHTPTPPAFLASQHHDIRRPEQFGDHRHGSQADLRHSCPFRLFRLPARVVPAGALGTPPHPTYSASSCHCEALQPNAVTRLPQEKTHQGLARVRLRLCSQESCPTAGLRQARPSR